MKYPTPPSSADLVAIALRHTDFLKEIGAASPNQTQICAELSAELAAEHWELTNGAPIGTLGPSLTSDAVPLLVAYAKTMRHASDSALYNAVAKINRSVTKLAEARSAAADTLPLPAAEALMDGLEDHFDAIRVALTRAQDVLLLTIDQIEAPASHPVAEVA